MAMNFNRPAGAPTTAVAAKPETALMEVQPYDIIADQQATQKQLAHSPEIESLTAGMLPSAATRRKKSPRHRMLSCAA